MATLNHSITKGNIAFELNKKHGNQFDIYSSLDLELMSVETTADLCIFPKTPHNWQIDVVLTKETPILAVEILSQGKILDDIEDKITNVYFPAGMKSVWVASTKTKTVMLFRPNEKTKTYNGGILQDEISGFELDIDKIFT